MKRCFVLFLCVLFIFPLVASVDARFIENDSQIYSEIDTLYALSSLSSPNTNRPWTESQARLYLSRIDPDSLSEEGRAIYESAKEEIESLRRIDSSMASLLRDMSITKADIE